MSYQKLVRDQIPQIIRQNGKNPIVRILEDEEYTACLHQKLDEEVKEFHQDKNAEELADILEVVYALAADLGVSRGKLMEIFEKKHTQRGGFAQRVFLEGVEEDCL